ncbi:MAG: hypothetical protein JXR91_03900 [Deltaproteobacteria bacterium]|nr:hypothetical protein [Deltaproteobacteria bacterium]
MDTKNNLVAIDELIIAEDIFSADVLADVPTGMPSSLPADLIEININDVIIRDVFRVKTPKDPVISRRKDKIVNLMSLTVNSKFPALDKY